MAEEEIKPKTIELLKKIQQRRDFLFEKLYGFIEEMTPLVTTLDVPSIINSYEVKIERYCFTHRGSDNYLVYGRTLKSHCNYWNYYETYLTFPDINETLTRGTDRYADEEEKIVSVKYPDKDRWEEIAKELENETKKRMLKFYETRYNKNTHIASLAANKFRCALFIPQELQDCYQTLQTELCHEKSFDLALLALKQSPAAFEELLLQDFILNKNTQFN